MRMVNDDRGFIGRNAKIITPCAVMFGASSGILGVLTAAPALAIGFWRLAVTLPFFVASLLCNSEKREALKNIEKGDMLWCCISGFFLFSHYFCWFNGAKMTNIASASVLAAFHPLVVLLITVVIYKKKVGIKSIIAILVALGGGAMIAGLDYATLSASHVAGNIMAIFAGIFVGIYFAIGDKVRQTVDGDVYVTVLFASCWVCFIVASLATKTPLLGYTAEDYFYIILMAIICQVGAHGLFNLCIGHVSALYVSTWGAGEPIFATLLAVVFLSQIPTLYEVVGCIIVIGALLYYNYQESRDIS